MATILQVARYILQRLDYMSTMKLEKLCFYSQALSLVRTGKPLFAEEFQAWRNGPVAPALYQQHKGMFIIRADDLGAYDASLSASEILLINDICEALGSLNGKQLSKKTHAETPWRDARKGLQNWEIGHEIITQQAMKSYYAQHDLLHSDRVPQ